MELDIETVISLVLNIVLLVLSVLFRKRYVEAVRRLREIIEILVMVERCLTERYVPAEVVRTAIAKAKRVANLDRR